MFMCSCALLHINNKQHRIVYGRARPAGMNARRGRAGGSATVGRARAADPSACRRAAARRTPRQDEERLGSSAAQMLIMASELYLYNAQVNMLSSRYGKIYKSNT